MSKTQRLTSPPASANAPRVIPNKSGIFASPSPSAVTLRALTPKEFSDAVGGLLCPETIRRKCASGELPTAHGPKRRPYFIHPSALQAYRGDLSRFLVAV